MGVWAIKLTCVKTEEAVGMIIPHDITRIVKGGSKGPAFKKGHVIKEEDIPLLLEIGKEHIYSLQLEDGDVHEDEAGQRIAEAATGKGLELKGPSEGKVELIALTDGLLKINIQALQQLNSLPDVIMATLHNNTPVKKGDKVAGTRVIPLVVHEQTVAKAEEICREGAPLVEVRQYRSCKLGALITGREVYEGRVKDAFSPVMREKARSFNLEEPKIVYAPDEPELIASKIKELIAEGVDLVAVTGGMSVDPDDVTPRGIRLSGANVEKYGAPVLPGAMFLLAYHGRLPIVGVPACGMYFRTTIFDLVLPRLLVGERPTAQDLAALGHGGFCRSCQKCSYPHCSFGKGGIN
ncbi:MAG: molybdopterin-binding protein [Dethiobacteria bacterium]|jgi:hypothetical protein|nr:molybdopterin-binding protein [Bacillota bacterium]